MALAELAELAEPIELTVRQKCGTRPRPAEPRYGRRAIKPFHEGAPVTEAARAGPCPAPTAVAPAVRSRRATKG